MDKNKGIDDAFEAQLEQAVAENFRAKMEAMPSPEETLREHPLSDEHTRKMEKLFVEERRRPVMQKIRLLVKAAVWVLCITTAVVAINPQARAAVWDRTVQFFESIAVMVPIMPTPKTARDFAPKVLPAGYAFESRDMKDGRCTTVYRYPGGHILIFQVEPIEMYDIGFENLELYTETHDGIVYTIYKAQEESSYSFVAWEMDDYAFSLYGMISVDELLTVSRSVE